MVFPILSVNIRHEQDTVAVRQRARQVAKLLGFEVQDQTRIATAVSEIARNAFRYAAGGKAEFMVEAGTAQQMLVIRVSDDGPGIDNLERILEGRYRSSTGMGLGIVGARRLMDDFLIESGPGSGTTVLLKKTLPRRGGSFNQETLGRLTTALAAEKPQGAFEELQLQNQELLRTLEELRRRQDDLARVNRELEDTNRGVVALYAELDEKADHLRRADELKSKFLSNMSHEFRSPLNSILALARLLTEGVDGPLNGEQQQQVGYIRKAAEDLYELVNDLLDLAKVEAGKTEVKPARFEIANFFGALRGMLRPLFLNQSVNLVFEETAHLPTMFSDEAKISQILRNFISNALKFTERGEVRVSAKLVSAGRIMFSVADTGIGIAKEDQERIFQDFAQIDNPIQRRVKGTGLGLPLSRRLARLLGGDLELESEPGKGSTFSVVLPLTSVEQTPKYVAAGWKAIPGTIPVLAVENSPETVLVYQKWLKDSEFQLVPAASVSEARQKLSVITPGAIVLDILLDGEDTWDFLRSLRESPQTNHIPVLVVSTVDEQRKGFHIGAAGYLAKPIEADMLRNELRRVTAGRPLDQILIIDDNERDRYLFRHWLKNSSLMITEASTGREGLTKARQEHPKLILLDLAMPEMSGFEVLDHLKDDPETNEISVIVSTSMHLDKGDRDRLASRAVAILSKENLDRDQALKAISEALGA
jgi:signal transduction histidine kinase/CheY-like chemotaxis protein